MAEAGGTGATMGRTIAGERRASSGAHAGRPRRPVAVAAARALVALVVVVITTLAATGWLDLLRTTGTLRFGPLLHEALPLQRLARSGAQPLARVTAAWLPAGAVAGAVLRAVGFARRPARGALMFVGCLVLLLVLGGAADAITESDPLASHLGQQPHRLAIWVAALLVAAGASLPGRGPRRLRSRLG